MLREEIEVVFDKYIERLIKIILKGTKASAASLYALMSLLSANMISEASIEDLLANAFKQSAVYMKQKEKTDAAYAKEASEFLHTAQSIIKKEDNPYRIGQPISACRYCSLFPKQA